MGLPIHTSQNIPANMYVQYIIGKLEKKGCEKFRLGIALTCVCHTDESFEKIGNEKSRL